MPVKRPRLTLACFIHVAALSSCESDKQRTTFRDSGSACVEEAASFFDGCSVREIPADVPLEITVDFEICTSSSCDTVLNAACRAAVSGSVITITAEAVVESEDGACTLDCGMVTASCELPPLPAGTYELRYGNSSAPLTVPSTTALGCARSDDGIRCCDTSADCGGSPCEDNHCRIR